MRKLLVVLFVLAITTVPCTAATISLFDYAWIFAGPGFNLNTAGFDNTTGLGVIEITAVNPGVFDAMLFVDHEIDENVNTFFNEYGSVVGSAPAGLSWEIDEPGYTYGDIWLNYTNASLDNSNGVPSSAPDDVSMALHWKDIALAANEQIIFRLSTVAPSTGFYLVQTDPDSKVSIYFSTTAGEAPPIPEPSTVILLVSGLAVIGFARFKKSA